MRIGEKIKRMRLRLGLTQEELASRTELSKGFISQLEREQTSPSIATLMDIVEALGSDIGSFFNEAPPEKVVFGADDMFAKEDSELKNEVCWLVTSSQKNALEPILVTLLPGGRTVMDDPHEGEEFGYVLAGRITLRTGKREYTIKTGGSFCLHPSTTHSLHNSGKTKAKVLWVSTPPSF